MDQQGKGQVIGYARTSTIEQVAGFEAQIAALEKVGCTKIYREQISGAKTAGRDELAKALDFVREGDIFVVTKIDRLARSLPDLLNIVKLLTDKGVALRILTENIDTAAVTGKLMLHLLGAIADFERDTMLERQRVGIAAAKSRGIYKGRQPTARAKTNQIMALAAQGGMTRQAIANQLGVGVASVYRVLAESKTTV